MNTDKYIATCTYNIHYIQGHQCVYSAETIVTVHVTHKSKGTCMHAFSSRIWSYAFNVHLGNKTMFIIDYVIIIYGILMY